MFSFKCPKCESKVLLWQRRSYKQYKEVEYCCKNCQSTLKLANRSAYCLLYTLFCVGVIANSDHWGIESARISILVALFICFLVFSVFASYFGKWKVTTKTIDPKAKPPAVKKLSGRALSCFALSMVALMGSSLVMILAITAVRGQELDSLEKNAAIMQIMLRTNMVGIPLFLVFAVAGIFFALIGDRKREEAETVDEIEEQQTTLN